MSGTEWISTTAEALEAEAMPRAHAVHADPEAETAEGSPRPGALARRRGSPAEWAYRRLVHYIAKFEEGLDAGHEVAMGYADGGVRPVRIEGIGFFDPDIVTFYGRDPDGGRVQLIQHVARLSVLLRAVPKARPEAAPRRIGFRLRADLEEAEEGVGTGDAGATGAGAAGGDKGGALG